MHCHVFRDILWIALECLIIVIIQYHITNETTIVFLSDTITYHSNATVLSAKKSVICPSLCFCRVVLMTGSVIIWVFLRWHTDVSPTSAMTCSCTQTLLSSDHREVCMIDAGRGKSSTSHCSADRHHPFRLSHLSFALSHSFTHWITMWVE